MGDACIRALFALQFCRCSGGGGVGAGRRGVSAAGCCTRALQCSCWGSGPFEKGVVLHNLHSGMVVHTMSTRVASGNLSATASPRGRASPSHGGFTSPWLVHLLRLAEAGPPAASASASSSLAAPAGHVGQGATPPSSHELRSRLAHPVVNTPAPRSCPPAIEPPQSQAWLRVQVFNFMWPAAVASRSPQSSSLDA